MLQRVLVGIIVVGIGLGLFIFLGRTIQAPSSSINQQSLLTPPKPSRIFPTVETEARAYIVYDMVTGEKIIGKNEDISLPLASLSKIMTAYAVLSYIPSNTLIRISPESFGEYGNTGLVGNDVWYIGDLARYLLTNSSNDGARALCIAFSTLIYKTKPGDISPCIYALNFKEKELGLHHTTFINSTGLDVDDSLPSNVGSAYDTARLFDHVYKTYPDLFSTTILESATFRSATGHTYEAKNTNEILSQIPNLKASKTGFTDSAGGNLAIIFEPILGHPVTIVVLGSSQKGRFNDMLTLVNATQKYFAQ